MPFCIGKVHILKGVLPRIITAVIRSFCVYSCALYKIRKQQGDASLSEKKSRVKYKSTHTERILLLVNLRDYNVTGSAMVTSP